MTQLVRCDGLCFGQRVEGGVVVLDLGVAPGNVDEEPGPPLGQMRRQLGKVDLGCPPDRLPGVAEFDGNRYPVDRDRAAAAEALSSAPPRRQITASRSRVGAVSR